MNILIFGKDGQLGKASKAVFDAMQLDKYHYIRYVGRAECELSNADAVEELLNQIQPELIVNTAAYTAVDKAETEADLAYAINATAPEAMAMYAVQHGATFLHYSTDYVFDGSKPNPYLESDERSPLCAYGRSKAAGEEAIEKAFRAKEESHNELIGAKLTERKAQYAILRTSWVYGEGDNFIRTILHLAKERESLKVIADQYGVPTSADWLARISCALMLNEDHELRSFPSGIYHAVPKGETTWHTLACYAVQAAIDAGEVLKLRPDAIEAIPTSEYPLLAPRPMNSRLAIGPLNVELSKTLDKVQRVSSDMTKSQLVQQTWKELVAVYVKDLVLRKLI